MFQYKHNDTEFKFKNSNFKRRGSLHEMASITVYVVVCGTASWERNTEAAEVAYLEISPLTARIATKATRGKLRLTAINFI